MERRTGWVFGLCGGVLTVFLLACFMWGGWCLGGCGGVGTGEGDSQEGNGEDVGASSPVSASGSFTASDGFSQQTLTIGGEPRTVALYAPASRGDQPPLVIAFHGTSGEPTDWIDSASDSDPSGFEGLADANGFLVAAPRARDWGDGASDWDNHNGNDRYWETRFDANPSRGSDPDANADLVLVRQIITAAEAAFNVDPNRVYLIGFSNGGFFSELAAMVLRDQIAAFAAAGSGLVTCDRTDSCTSQANTTNCSGIPSCPCSGTEKPTTVPTSGRLVPGILGHNSADDTVSSFYTCAMATRMQALGYDVSVQIANTSGHGIPEGFIDQAWGFFSSRQLP